MSLNLAFSYVNLGPYETMQQVACLELQDYNYGECFMHLSVHMVTPIACLLQWITGDLRFLKIFRLMHAQNKTNSLSLWTNSQLSQTMQQAAYYFEAYIPVASSDKKLRQIKNSSGTSERFLSVSIDCYNYRYTTLKVNSLLTLF